jgi:hypothetical protein
MKYFLVTLLIVIVSLGLWIGSSIFGSDAIEEKNAELEAMSASSTSDRPRTVEPFTGYGTLASLKDFNASIECSINYKTNDVEPEIEGTYFIHDGMVRGDFIVQSPQLGGQVVTSIISDKTTFYVWSEINGQSFGSKTPIQSEDSIAAQEPVPRDARVQYACKAWTQIDGSIFEPPARVVFRDQATMLETGGEFGIVE